MEQRDSFENYLREFEPKRPRALPAQDERKHDWRQLAAAAAVFIAVGTASWFAALRKGPNGSAKALESTGTLQNRGLTRLSLTSLTKLAVENPKRLDAALTEASRRMLPDFRGKESGLRVLAKE